jgi:hypothetical protein
VIVSWIQWLVKKMIDRLACAAYVDRTEESMIVSDRDGHAWRAAGACLQRLQTG